MNTKIPQEIVGGVKKMAQVVKATQKMEHFIKSVCEAIFQGEKDINIEVSCNFILGNNTYIEQMEKFNKRNQSIQICFSKISA